MCSSAQFLYSVHSIYSYSWCTGNYRLALHNNWITHTLIAVKTLTQGKTDKMLMQTFPIHT